MKVFLVVVSIIFSFFITGCTSTSQKMVSPSTGTKSFSSWAIGSILPILHGEQTARIDQQSVGTATWIWSKKLITTAHSFADTNLWYLLRDASGNICDIIHTQFHPTLDLAVFEVYGSCTGISLETQIVEKNSNTTYVRKDTTLASCSLLQKDLTEATTDCLFIPGMSWSPVIDAQSNLVWLVKGTDPKQGYMLLFNTAIRTRITNLL